MSHGSGVVRLRAGEIRLPVVVRIDDIAFFIFSMTFGASGNFAAILELAAASAAFR